MTYPLIRQGDKLPAVGVLQKLLNARVASSLTPDGDFGPRTKAAVQEFQRTHTPLVPDGAVGINTWPRIKYLENNLNIVDCVDVFDPDLYALETQDIRRSGGNPLLMGGASNGVEQAITNILTSVPANSVFILRFHGHGAPGVAGVSDGHGSIPGEHLSSIHAGNWTTIEPHVRRLRTIFGPYGCIQFMHCETGNGPQGRDILQKVAIATDVPATGGIRTQYGGGLRTFRFEGPTYTAFPSGDLQSWSRARPEFPGMTVP